MFCGISSVGRALASQAEGHEFEPRIPLTKEEVVFLWGYGLFFCLPGSHLRQNCVLSTEKASPWTVSPVARFIHQKGFSVDIPFCLHVLSTKKAFPWMRLHTIRESLGGKTGSVASKAGAEPYSQIGVVFGEAEFAADVTADDVVAFLLEIVAHILAFQSENIEAAVAYLPVR